MTCSEQCRSFVGLPIAAVATLFLMFAAMPAPAQTFTVLHAFTDTSDGALPVSGLALDRNGTVYGTTDSGGIFNNGDCFYGCGVVFRLTNRTGSWVFSFIYSFQGEPDGFSPEGVTVGPDGTLYGLTYEGGQGGYSQCIYAATGCGTIFHLQPPAYFCTSVNCPWSETVLHRFTGSEYGDGAIPMDGDSLVFDHAGNMYGTASYGGTHNYGTVFEASPGQGGWTENTLYSFSGGGSDGWATPESGLIMDSSGNLYGTTTEENQYASGVLYQLSPSGGSWVPSVLQAFQCSGSEGCYPQGLIQDASGNVYLLNDGGGANGGGTAVELMPSQGWSSNVLSSFSRYGDGPYGPVGKMARDAQGNLYGASAGGGTYGHGTVFKLTPDGSGGWTSTVLHSFSGEADGSIPYAGVVVDAHGNIFGTTIYGGDMRACNIDGCGVVYEITP